jgi:hypothetical protein
LAAGIEVVLDDAFTVGRVSKWYVEALGIAHRLLKAI